MTVIEIARLFLFVREAGANKGQRVESIQHWCLGQPGDSWCCEFATMVLDIFYRGNAPIPRLRACQEVYDLAKRRGMITTTPQPGDIFLYVNDQDHAHHIGFVTALQPLTGIAGNTSADGTSSNGDRVAEHGIGGSHIRFVHYQ